MTFLFKKIFSLFLVAVSLKVYAQVYPVKGNASLIPPYSVYLTDYTSRSTERLVLNVVLNDITRPELRVRLRMKIESQNIKLETKPEYIGSEIIVQGGIPLRLSGIDLTEYFNPNNLNFTGITRKEFEKTGSLLEGFYQFSFEVLEYNRGVKISNPIVAPGWLILNDPPIVNLPRNNDKLKPTQPQNLIFQWTPRHTGSPNSAFATEYNIEMVEIWPANRNPNDAILTSPRILEATTRSTSFIFGPAETPLELGRRYAFRIQAKSLVGAEEYDLFKNNGYSEVVSFIYGDACEMPGNIRVQTGANKFKIIWDGQFNHSAYTFRYRQEGTPNWYESNTAINEINIYSLTPNTTYEYQLAGACGVFEGEYSPIATLKTNDMGEASYSCGLPLENFNLDPAELIPSLKVGDIIQAGDFQVKLAKVSGGNGTFSGEGVIEVPFFNKASVKAEFTNIAVNKELRMVNGHMNVTGAGVEVIPSGVMDLMDKLDETLNALDTALTNMESNLGPFDENAFVPDLSLTLPGPAIVVPNADGSVTVTDGNGVQHHIPKGTEAAIIDSDGNGFLIDPKGKIHEVSASVALAAANREYNLKLTFSEGDNPTYGFDAKKYDALAGRYDSINGNYFIPYKSVEVGKSSHVVATLEAGAIDKSKIRFEASGVPVAAPPFSGQSSTIPILGKSDGEQEGLIAILSPADTAQKNQVLGRVNVVSYNAINKKLIIVPVNGNTYSFGTASTLQTELNKIYSQAVVNWSVDIKEGITVPGISPFNVGETGMLTNYTDHMKEVINAYKNNMDGDQVTYYLFLVSSPSDPTIEGIMPRDKKSGFIFKDKHDSEVAIARTIAHELGHGVFNLHHTFMEENFSVQKGTTDNLMDYLGGTKLYKYQWDLIRYPAFVIELFESDEEAASVKVYDSLPNLFLNNDKKSFSFITPSGSIIRLPTSVTNTVFFHGIETKKFINVVTGVLVGFTIDKVKYRAVVDESGNFAGYSDGTKFYTDNSLAQNTSEDRIIMGLPASNKYTLYSFSVPANWPKYSFQQEKVKQESSIGLLLFSINKVLNKAEFKYHDEIYNTGYTSISAEEVSAIKEYADKPELLYILKIKEIQNAYPQAYRHFTSLSEDDWDFPFKLVEHSGLDPADRAMVVKAFGHWGEIIKKSQVAWTDKFNNDKVAYFSGMLDALKLFIDDYSKKVPKNIVLFVNGYRFSFPEKPDTDNTITRIDRYQYWEGLDQQFANRFLSATWLYADGHHSISTSNHNDMGHFYCSARSAIPAFPASVEEAAIKYADDAVMLTLTGIPMKLFISTSLDAACSQYAEGKLNTDPNSAGFEIRYNSGKVAGQNLLNDIKNGKIPVNMIEGKITDSLDIVAHSMGFAYAQGMIEVLKGKIPLAGYYIIAPENASSGNITLSDFTLVWQYGSDENIDISKQDGVAPQVMVGNLTNDQRAFIPNGIPQGFISSHAIGNYYWIFTTELGKPGYVKAR